jgi:chitinase
VAAAGDLSRADARTLRSYADRHGLAWLSLRGTTSAAVLSDLRD